MFVFLYQGKIFQIGIKKHKQYQKKKKDDAYIELIKMSVIRSIVYNNQQLGLWVGSKQLSTGKGIKKKNMYPCSRIHSAENILDESQSRYAELKSDTKKILEKIKLQHHKEAWWLSGAEIVGG